MQLFKIGLLSLLLGVCQMLYAQTPLKLIVTDPTFSAFTAGDISAYKSTFVTRSFIVRNTSNAAFTGRILLKDVIGSSLSVEDIVVTYEDGSLPKGIGPNAIDANWTGLSKTLSHPVSGTDYFLDITNLPSSIGKNAGLIFTRRVKVMDCIDANAKGLSEVYLSVCATGSATGDAMSDAWENTNTRLIQRITKKLAEFVNIVDYKVANGGYCAYNATQDNLNAYRTVSLVAKMNDAASGETVQRFGFQLSGSTTAAIPNSRVRIYKAIKNSGGHYIKSGSPLAITPTVELNPIYSYIPVFLQNGTSCVTDAIQYGFYEVGNLTGNDAYYIEFDVMNCEPPIDLNNFQNGANEDNWSVAWRGLDDCGTILTNASKPNYDIFDNQQDIRPTTLVWSHSIFGAGYGDYVANKFTYTERVTSLFTNSIGNNRLSNTFDPNVYAFKGTSYSDGFNYQVRRGKIVVALKIESGLDYYTGPTTGGYFDRMHFRNPDGKQWLPTSQAGSSTPLYGIPTDESPLKSYDEIHFFEFDLNTFYSLYPNLATATSSELRYALYDYLNASDLVYSMRANCNEPNKKDKVNYSVEMYFVLDASCNNPLVYPSSKITRDAQVMCPGCMFPGGAGAGVNIQRNTFGYSDRDDNHLPDSPAANWTEAEVAVINQDNDPDNNIRTSFGIVGDHIKMKTEYYLTGSESCNGATWNDLMIGPLTYSYLFINFPKDSIAIDTSVPIKFKINSGGVVYSFTAPVTAIVDLGNGPREHIFALNTSVLNTYKDASSAALPAGFRFHSFDKIQYEFELNVLLNSNTALSYQEVFFTHMPFFSAVPLSQRTGDFPQFSCDPVHGPSWKDEDGIYHAIDLPPYDNNSPYHTTFLLCEGYEGIFNLVPVIQNVRYSGTGGASTEETDANCIKERDYGIESSIGVTDEKRLFVSEVRQAPQINEIDIIAPQGYRVVEIFKYGGFYNDNLPVNIRAEDLHYTPATLPPVSSQVFNVGGESYTKQHYVFPDPAVLTDADINSATNQTRVFDEKSYHQINVFLEAICSELEGTPDLLNDQPAGNQNVVNKVYMSMDAISPVDDYLMSTPVKFLKPFNGLTSTISQTGIVGAVSSNFNVNFSLIKGATGTARYPFISLEYKPSEFSNFTLSSTGAPVQLVESVTLPNGNIKAVYSITLSATHPYPYVRYTFAKDQSIPFAISGSLEKCFDNPNNPASFKIGYGWDCNGFPTSVADATGKCFVQEEELKVYSILSGLQSEISAQTEGDACVNPQIKYSHRLVSTGSQITQVTYKIDLPAGLSLKTGSIVLKYGATTFASADYMLTDISTPANTGLYTLQLKPTALAAIPFAGAVVQGTRQEELLLSFNALVASGCNVYLATSLSTVDVTALNFCSSTLTNHSQVTPAYQACGNTYTVSIKGEPLYCKNPMLAAPVTLTAVLPDLSASVCYTLPVTFEWRVLGTTAVIGTNQVLNTTITQSTTFEVTATDAAGRKAKATYTVDYDFEYQIGDINYVCGDPNTRICVPVDAKRVVRNGIIGMDFCMKYDKRFVTPITTVDNSNLGIVVKGTSNYPATYFMTSNASPVIEANPNIGYVHVSIYYTNNNAAHFTGQGRVICVPFTVVGSAPVGQGFTFEMCEMYESYTLQERKVCWGPGTFKVVNSPNMAGQLVYYQANNNLITATIGGFPWTAKNRITSSVACGSGLSTYATDDNGKFNFTIGTATTFSISRDIDNYFTTPYSYYFRNFVNAVDTRAMEFIATMNATSPFTGTTPFIPTAGQMIAGDVNMSDSLRANDITLTQRRMLGLIGEYPQVQNRISLPSLDWRFIEDSYLTTLNDYKKSTAYPFFDGSSHFWRDNIPNVPACFTVQKQCYNSAVPVYKGILLGDLINSNTAYFSNPYIRSTEQIPYAFDVNLNSAIVVTDREYLIPVKYTTPDTTLAYAFDFDLDYQNDSLMIVGLSMDPSIEAKQPRLAWTDDAIENTLKSTNYTMGFWGKSGTVYYISVVRTSAGPLTANDFKAGRGLINGIEAPVTINGKRVSTTTGNVLEEEDTWVAQVVPNPADDQGKLIFRFTQSASENYIKILDVVGQELNNYRELPQEGSIDLKGLPAGMYLAHFFDKATGKNRVVKFVKK
jgi:hypothetical protein